MKARTLAERAARKATQGRTLSRAEAVALQRAEGRASGFTIGQAVWFSRDGAHYAAEVLGFERGGVRVILVFSGSIRVVSASDLEARS